MHFPKEVSIQIKIKREKIQLYILLVTLVEGNKWEWKKNWSVGCADTIFSFLRTHNVKKMHFA